MISIERAMEYAKTQGFKPTLQNGVFSISKNGKTTELAQNVAGSLPESIENDIREATITHAK